MAAAAGMGFGTDMRVDTGRMDTGRMDMDRTDMGAESEPGAEILSPERPIPDPPVAGLFRVVIDMPIWPFVFTSESGTA